VFLALNEMRRARVRFALLVGAVALLAFLILFQQAIRDSLLDGFVGGVRNQTAPVLVFDVDGRRVAQGSTITADLDATVRRVPGVASVGEIRQATFPVDLDGTGPVATSVLAYQDPALGGPRLLASGRLPAAPGEVVANVRGEGPQLAVGDRLQAQPGGVDLTVVGTAEGVGINVLPTLFTTTETYLDLVRTRNPGANLPPPNVLGLAPAAGVTPTQLAEAVSGADDRLDALTSAAAADGNPGVQSISQSFGVVFVLFAVVVPLVTGLFFLILTTQKRSALTLLRAIGAPSRRLVTALLTQVGAVLVVGLGAAGLLYAGISAVDLGGLALTFDPATLAAWVGVLASLGVLSSLASIRRVLAVDPIAATREAGR
jgi:putative ABC transport system permease protein